MAVNPADPNQVYTLSENGLILPHGNAFPISQTSPPPTYNERPGPPPYASAFQITNWTNPAGYTMDFFGEIQEWGGAPVVASPEPIEGLWQFRDFTVDPATGRGYRLRDNGTIDAFGGAAALPAPNLGGLRTARRIIWNWATGTGYVMDAWGGFHPLNGAPVINGQFNHSHWKGWDICRDLVIANWTTGAAYALDGWGGLHAHNGAPVPFGNPYWKGLDIARDLHLVRGGAEGHVTEFILMDAAGALHRWVMSTPPSVTISAPTGTIETNMPILRWAFNDAERHKQAAFEVRLAAGLHTASTPPSTTVFRLDGTDPSIRSASVDIDLPRGDYTVYVRAKDASDKWSDWARGTFTVSPPVLNPPTIRVAASTKTVGGNEIRIDQPADHVTASRYTVEYKDPADSEWSITTNGYLVTVGTMVTDFEVPTGVARSYRARQVRQGAQGYNSSEPGPTVTAPPAAGGTDTDAGAWSLLDITTGTAARIFVLGEFEFTEEVEAGVFLPLGRENAIVISDGANRGLRTDLNIVTLSQDDYKALVDRKTGIARPGRTLLLRDGFGRAWYVQVSGGIRHAQAVRGGADQNLTIPLTEVTRPTITR